MTKYTAEGENNLRSANKSNFHVKNSTNETN